MKQYLAEFFDIYSYPEEARETLEYTYDRIYSDSLLKKEFQEYLNVYARDMQCEFLDTLEQVKEFASKVGIHEYTVNLLYVICLSKKLRENYSDAGIDDQIWLTTMCDIKWKMFECKDVYGIWGTFVPWWYRGFLRMSRFGFGLLQFEMTILRKHYEKNGIVLEPDHPVINVHIPRTGAKLDRESMRDSYRQASEFFKTQFQDKPIVFRCRTWFLYPRNLEFLSPQSNLYAFYADYDIIEQGTFDDYEEAWRIFDKNYDGDVSKLPQDTSLRRAYAEWIRKGEKMGWGIGVFIYDC